MSSRAAKRLAKELEAFNDSEVLSSMYVDVDSPTVWRVHIINLKDTLYDGESFILRFTFGENYPIESPEVVFIPPAPVHPHIYSNGHICLNILYNDWTPALTVKSVCYSIISMLASCVEKELPKDNARYVSVPRRSPKDTTFMFHDDTV